MTVVEVTGSDLKILLRSLTKPEDVYKLSFSIDLDQVKVKVNERIWSPPMGKKV